ncbi:class I SAM-dependent methyltransferase [Telmatospirillum sp. J64-1]|uniref:class I SAM-dependent methyltransferase n=1 Tax=Telmatospirillum sp. J64-1 TaxID=2502183 RepID=UPI002105F753|nr:methyltransferase domain-containing protein [Telmatospirillum sp. J64-1]
MSAKHKAMLSYPPMWTDVVELRDFYDSSLGQVARRLIRRQLRTLWPSVRGQRVLGLGYATPYLRPFRDEAARLLAVMPPTQGVMPWPPEGRSLVALADETELPLPDRSMDRILMVHAMESTEQVRAMMREAWRVLSDSGRIIVIVPNRGGIWTRLERTPFGNGRPYSQGQLARQLRETMFTPLQTSQALFLPPSQYRLVLRSAQWMERLGNRWFPRFAGVLMVEAAKEFYAATPVAKGKRSRVAIALPHGFRRDGEEQETLPGCQPTPRGVPDTQPPA